MRKRFDWEKKYLRGGITAFCVIAAATLFYMALSFLPALGGALKTLFGIMSPFVWGLAICYLISPLLNAVETKLFRPLAARLYRKSRTNKGEGLARALSVLAAEAALLAALAAMVWLILPQLFQSIETIVNTSPKYIADAGERLAALLDDYPALERFATAALGSVSRDIVSWLNSAVLARLGSLITNLTSGVCGAVKAVYNLVIGIIVSCYILSSKEKFIAGAKRALYAALPVAAARRLLEGLRFMDKTFMGFIAGKLLDSAIVGVICYIGCALFRLPYALLVSVIVGVTDLIPFFGPVIGAVPCALIILLVDPMKSLIFIAFVVLLQQLDGNLIGPKILGSSTGINGFWVMFSIILGAGLFGFWGMLLGVPVFVVIYTVLGEGIDKKLRRGGLPVDAEDYIDLSYIDPATREPVRAERK